MSTDETRETKTHASVYGSPVYVDTWGVATLFEHDGGWFTGEDHTTDVPGFRPIKIVRSRWGGTFLEAVDAIYEEIEIQSPDFLVMHIGKAQLSNDARNSFRVGYSYVDFKGQRQERQVCTLYRDGATGHWVTAQRLDRTLEAPRGHIGEERFVSIPIRLWGRDKATATMRVRAYVDGILAEQDRQRSESVIEKVREQREQYKANEQPTIALAMKRLEEALEYGEKALRRSEYQSMVTLGTALSALRHATRNDCPDG